MTQIYCINCGTGKAWWSTWRDKCLVCEGNPHIEGTAPPDWKERNRAAYVRRFGPRKKGDLELAERYSGK